MPKPFQLTLQTEKRADIAVAGEFSDAEAVILDAFLEQYEKLRSSQPIQNGIRCNIKVNYDENSGLDVAADLPTEDELSILLHRLRPFILQNEPASFVRTLGILSKHIAQPHLRFLFAQQREMYDGRLAQKQMRVTTEAQVINSEAVLNDWLNSHEYHRDPDKRAAIGQLFERVPSDLLRGLLVSMIVDKTRAIMNLASLVGVITGKSNKLQFTSRDLTPEPTADTAS